MLQEATLVGVIIQLIIIAYHYGRTSQLINDMGKRVTQLEHDMELKIDSKVCDIKMNNRSAHYGR